MNSFVATVHLAGKPAAGILVPPDAVARALDTLGAA